MSHIKQTYTDEWNCGTGAGGGVFVCCPHPEPPLRPPNLFLKTLIMQTGFTAVCVCVRLHSV